MKRRRFLGLSASGIGLAGMGPAAGLGDGRLFGTPMYARDPADALNDNRLRLVMSRIEMPVQAWEPLVALGRLWRTVLSDDQARQAFMEAPGKFLRRQGFSPSVLRQSRQEIQILRLICDPYVRHVASAGNYPAFINRLKEADLLQQDAESSLRQTIREILAKDADQLRASIRDLNLRTPQLSDPSQAADLYLIAQRLNAAGTMSESVAAAVVVVVVAALAATYVSVGVNVTVALNLGVTISVGVSVAVAASGSCDYCHADVGQIAALEPGMRNNLETTIRVARLTGQQTLEVEALKDYALTESRACLEAAESLGLVKLPADRGDRRALLDGVGRLTCQAAGLG